MNLRELKIKRDILKLVRICWAYRVYKIRLVASSLADKRSSMELYKTKDLQAEGSRNKEIRL